MINKLNISLDAVCRKLVFIFFYSCLFTSCSQNPHPNELKKIETQYLEKFFRHLFETTSAGYVLYGEKPLFLCTFNSIETTIPGTTEHRNAVILTQGLNAWRKQKIEGKNYLLFSSPGREVGSACEIILINTKAFNQVVRENLSLFRFKLGPQLNEKNLLENILSPSGFSTLLKGHEALQGILFGYGTENALTYERGNSLRKAALSISKLNPPFQFNQEPTTAEELKQHIVNYVNKHGGSGQPILDELANFSFYTPENDDEVIPKIPFSFHANSDESKKLLNDYKEAEKRVVSLQAEKKFLDKVLDRFRE